MRSHLAALRCLPALALVCWCIYPALAQKPTSAPAEPKAVIWTDPGNISSLDLYDGVGGKKNAPSAPFTYVKEDKAGTSPKFEVTDSQGEKWKAKLGPESHAEVVASRLLWAMGFAANENYFVAESRIPGAHTHQKRGSEFITADDDVRGIRLQRNPKHHKKTKGWAWNHNPFLGTREFNGLRVMMALLSNWDLKDDNNAIWEDKDNPSALIYGVTDVGASFGTSSKSFTNAISKNNLKAYRKHKFIANVTADHVDFNFPTHPSFIYYLLLELPFVCQERRHYWVGRNIPRKDVEWIASELSQLSHDQIHDAFRAGGYSPEKIDGFTTALEARVAELKKL